MYKITIREISKQLKRDLIGKDAFRGALLSYAWLANQFGHFSLGFIPTTIIFACISNKGNNVKELIDLPLCMKKIAIETIPINEYVDVAPEAIRYEGDTTIISVLKEVVVVRIFLKRKYVLQKSRLKYSIRKQSL